VGQAEQSWTLQNPPQDANHIIHQAEAALPAKIAADVYAILAEAGGTVVW